MSQTILLIPVTEAEEIVSPWRKKYDPSAIRGIPAHITILFPFKSSELISSEVINKLSVLLRSIKKFPFTLSKINTFPGVIYLEPDPREKFIEITKKVVALFPENPPYEGKYHQINPHLTLGHEFKKNIDINNVKRLIMDTMSNKLPIKAVCRNIFLMEKNAEHWNLKYEFLLS